MASRPPPSPFCPPADLSPLSAVLSNNALEGPVQSLLAAWARAGGRGSLHLPLFKEVSQSVSRKPEQMCQSLGANRETEGR